MKRVWKSRRLGLKANEEQRDVSCRLLFGFSRFYGKKPTE